MSLHNNDMRQVLLILSPSYRWGSEAQDPPYTWRSWDWIYTVWIRSPVLLPPKSSKWSQVDFSLLFLGIRIIKSFPQPSSDYTFSRGCIDAFIAYNHSSQSKDIHKPSKWEWDPCRSSGKFLSQNSEAVWHHVHYTSVLQKHDPYYFLVFSYNNSRLLLESSYYCNITVMVHMELCSPLTCR